MKKPLCWLLGLLCALAVNYDCAAAPDEKMVIERQVKLSAEFFPTPHGISHSSNGDVIVFGVTGRGIVADYRPWATRVSPTGEKRWEIRHNSQSDEGFYSAIELKDLTTLLCGVINLNRESTVVLDHLRADGSLIEEQLLHPKSSAGHLGGFTCAPWGGGFALTGSILYGPQGPTGWLAKVDEHLQLQWEKFDDQYAPGDLIQSEDGGLFMLSWSKADYFVLKLGPNGNILARQALPVGESHLAHPTDMHRSGVSVVTMLSTWSTELLHCDDQLRPKNKVKLHNVGVQEVIEQSDGTVTIFGSEFHNSATAAVTRIYRDGGHRGFLIKLPYQSPWYTAALATGTGNEVAATRDLIGGSERQFVLDIILFK